MTRVTQKDILGAHISLVYELDVGFDGDFLERTVILELESGLRIPLEQEHLIVPDPSLPAYVTTFDDLITCAPKLQRDSCPDLNSPIVRAFLPFGRDHFLGFLLENGFVLHDGFSMTENGLMFYRPRENWVMNGGAILLPED